MFQIQRSATPLVAQTISERPTEHRLPSLWGRQASVPASIKPTGKMPIGPTAKMAVPRSLQAQAFRNQNTIEQIETPLHQQCEQRGWDGALQDCGVIV